MNFVDVARCEVKDCSSRVFLTSLEIESMEFEKKNAYHKTCALVAISKRMVTDNPSGVQGGQID